MKILMWIGNQFRERPVTATAVTVGTIGLTWGLLKPRKGPKPKLYKYKLPPEGEYDPMPLASELWQAMDGWNLTGRVDPLTRLYGLNNRDTTKVYNAYATIAKIKEDPMTLTQRIRDENIGSGIKEQVLSKLNTLGLV